MAGNRPAGASSAPPGVPQLPLPLPPAGREEAPMMTDSLRQASGKRSGAAGNSTALCRRACATATGIAGNAGLQQRMPPLVRPTARRLGAGPWPAPGETAGCRSRVLRRQPAHRTQARRTRVAKRPIEVLAISASDAGSATPVISLLPCAGEGSGMRGNGHDSHDQGCVQSWPVRRAPAVPHRQPSPADRDEAPMSRCARAHRSFPRDSRRQRLSRR